MRSFGLNILGRAIYDATFSEMSAPFAHALSVVHAAHGAEIVIKARIAEEHPLLVFDQLPHSKTTTGELSVDELFLHGRSHDYSALPEILWAATGYRLANLQQYSSFGRLRNQIVHFAVPDVNLAAESLRFVLQVIEPMLLEAWNEGSIDYASAWDSVTVSEGYLAERIRGLQIELSPPVATRLNLLTRHQTDE